MNKPKLPNSVELWEGCTEYMQDSDSNAEDQYDKILIKVIYRKNGRYETDIAKELHNRILIEIRDENNTKVLMGIGEMNNDKY